MRLQKGKNPVFSALLPLFDSQGRSHDLFAGGACRRFELVRNVTELLSGEGTLPEYPLNRTQLRSEMICRRKRK